LGAKGSMPDRGGLTKGDLAGTPSEVQTITGPKKLAFKKNRKQGARRKYAWSKKEPLKNIKADETGWGKRVWFWGLGG